MIKLRSFLHIDHAQLSYTLRLSTCDMENIVLGWCKSRLSANQINNEVQG